MERTDESTYLMLDDSSFAEMEKLLVRSSLKAAVNAAKRRW